MAVMLSIFPVNLLQMKLQFIPGTLQGFKLQDLTSAVCCRTDANWPWNEQVCGEVLVFVAAEGWAAVTD